MPPRSPQPATHASGQCWAKSQGTTTATSRAALGLLLPTAQCTVLLVGPYEPRQE